ncbi:YciI family protein [Longispora sp. K20-0274]|uniref:YciI family protein n=1 Tax=Longispora sp. K20-0274 TaxID=3088255 RepID=UPI003999A088
MRYAMLIVSDESLEEAASPEEKKAHEGEIWAWFERWDGHFGEGGAEFQRTATARTIRGGVVTDGPYVELKEVIGGIVFLEADTLDAAVEIAATWPGLKYPYVSVEVRGTVTR